MDELRRRLDTLKEDAYADFQRRLLPGIECIMGVRMGPLRRLAAEIRRGDWLGTVQALDVRCYEEQMLKGLILATVKLDAARRKPLLLEFAGEINNWAVCDSTVSSCKFLKTEKAAWFGLLCDLARDSREYVSRFALVCMLDYCLEQACEARACLTLTHDVAPGRYYTDMARAWLTAEVCVRYPHIGFPMLEEATWDQFTRHMAARKVVESLRADEGMKARARQICATCLPLTRRDS